MQSLLVRSPLRGRLRLHRQEDVGPLLVELSKNGCWVCNASAWINTPCRSSWPISCSRSVAPPGIWATVQSRMEVHRATTSTCRKKYRKAESDGGRLSSIPNSSPSSAWWRRAKRSRSRRLSQPLRIPSTATSNRYQVGIRTHRRIRASGIALRKLIRSRSAAAEPVSGTEKEQSYSVNGMLKAQDTALVTHFESALGRKGPGGSGLR
jgi:hypothetical protein